jgi:hypothetical protein
VDREWAEQIVSEHVNRPEYESSDRTGIHIIPYGNVFIALESRANHVNRYLGWFTVHEKPVEMIGWTFVDRLGDCYLYQNSSDFLEE